jgi:hypothetical protein
VYVLRNFATGEYVKTYDAHWQPFPRKPQYPSGKVVWTPHANEAMKFDSFTDAFNCYRETSTTYPLRPDGKPNRPLTAHSVEISVL